jgi:23S rRNA (cytidine1920-2'-O)/16S rRNA (cytidine1409-2'-O)-methyltransferase
VRPTTSIVTVGDGPDWVSRAAYKLVAALDAFGGPAPDRPVITVAGKRCLDVGASTGGFTQVLLARGAREVVAVDVGHGQLAAQVAADDRVLERSGTNVRTLTPEQVGGPADLVVCDLSFISLRLVLDRLAALTGADGDLVALVKPQFEVGRQRLGKGGVVRAAGDRREAVLGVVRAARTAGLAPTGLRASPITGTTGNVEYLLWLRHRPDGMMGERDLVRAATELTGEEAR